MYKYEFVKIPIKSGFMKIRPTKDHREIIESYAKKGWRFKQIFAPGMSVYGTPSYFELIFEKEVY
jgi:hypothetical protein